MQFRSSRRAVLTLFLILTTILSSSSPAQPIVSAQRDDTRAEMAQTPPLDELCAQLNQSRENQVFLPLVTVGGSNVAAHTRATNPAPSQSPEEPGFVISSPAEGITLAGTAYFTLQPVGETNLVCAAFQAGDSDLGTDLTPEDGLQAFIDTSTLPTGQQTLTATAIDDTGTQTSASIDVTILADAPASAMIGSEGATLGTESGNTIIIPPGAIDGTANVSVVEKTQQQVTDDTGIDWERLGVTFLGSIDVKSDQPFERPIGVTSFGFSNPIQPSHLNQCTPPRLNTLSRCGVLTNSWQI
jgi:hypothetical protein